ncbi:MAG: biotin/lipoyl-binding protein [Rhodospirillaceae bacterium]|jgi:membrane fusion protein, heavy metal efflux system|nr:biotin/lipoyl-binding protein [Rhodospirillaceae bacterium]MBT6136253.1 biotin/lipoyl-binding protein [Rhodospirillaceae bacterium]
MLYTIAFAVAATVVVGAWELAGETAAEYFAKYTVDQSDLGASVNEPVILRDTSTPIIEKAVDDGTAALAIASHPILFSATTGPIATATNRTAATLHETEKQVATQSDAQGGSQDGSQGDDTIVTTHQDTETAVSEIPDPLLSLIGDTPHRRPDGTVFMPIAAQRVFGLRTVLADRLSIPKTSEFPGHVVPNPSTGHLAQLAQEGFIEVAEGGFPFIGQRVRRGDLLAYLKPTLDTLGQAQMTEQIQNLANKIELARKRMARLEEVLFVRYRASKIEQIRVEIMGLRRQLAILEGSVFDRVPIRAKTDGIVSHVSVAAGQYVDAGETLFEIVDPTRLWVKASAFEIGIAEKISSATAVTADGTPLSLRFVGGGLSLQNQAIPLQFEVLDPPAGLTVDTPVTVVVRGRRVMMTGVRVPRESVVRTSDGLRLVWERRSAESFVPHHVSAVPIDADSILVTSRLSHRLRVVTRGAGVLSQVQ